MIVTLTNKLTAISQIFTTHIFGFSDSQSNAFIAFRF